MQKAVDSASYINHVIFSVILINFLKVLKVLKSLILVFSILNVDIYIKQKTNLKLSNTSKNISDVFM